MCNVCISAEQGVARESATFAFVIRAKDDEDVLDGHLAGVRSATK